MAGGTQDPWHRTQDTEDTFISEFQELEIIRAEGMHWYCSVITPTLFGENTAHFKSEFGLFFDGTKQKTSSSQFTSFGVDFASQRMCRRKRGSFGK